MSAVTGPVWKEGPPLRPSEVLLAWIEEHARGASNHRRLFRLPVVVRFEDEYRLAIESACIGTSEQDCRGGAIPLTLDDTGMGSPLVTSLGPYCTRSSRVCVVWLEGLWGRLVELPDLQPDAKTFVFAVTRVVGPVEGDGRPSVRLDP